ncbi:four-helix bundle copper-binding protein [Alteribacillus iranensis]|nr:four-helix bundle copper-binding protein [Alteribacillus iranensis]
MIVVTYEECIKECLNCMEQCNLCFDECLKEEDVTMMATCIRLNRECADACAFAAKAMQSNSPFAKEICRLCADICQACGDECAKHNEKHCQDCAEACHRCAKVCREMAAS